jgi:hypothetical protein
VRQSRTARVTTRRAVRRRSTARTRAGGGRVPCRGAGMPSVLRKHLVDSSWLTLVGNGFSRSSCGLAADWASSADHWAAPSRHSLSVIKDWAAACPRTASAAQIRYLADRRGPDEHDNQRSRTTRRTL